MGSQIKCYESAQYANPIFFKQNKPTLESFKASITYLGYFNLNEINEMLAEFVKYVTITDELDASVDRNYVEIMELTLSFWRQNKRQLPKLFVWAQYVCSFLTSSAAVERVFSILKSSFTERQERSLEDLVKLSLMRQYNNRVIE